jgi:hypothetical protein
MLYRIVATCKVLGGTAPERVREQIAAPRARLA